MPRRVEAVGQVSNASVLLQAVSPVTRDTVWASGHGGTYVRTFDGGETWMPAVVPGAEELQFRDVHAFSSTVAYLMSAGEGALSRIYRTDDGGASWVLQYTADHPRAFLDCMSFWDETRGLAYGDAVDGVPFILRTFDGGATWTRVPAASLPSAPDGEGGFAASGTCLVTGPGGRAWLATGNANPVRVLGTEDYGAAWQVSEVPMVGGTGSGLTTVQMSTSGVGLVAGGTIGSDSLRSENIALTSDWGGTWTGGLHPEMLGPVYGSALVDDSLAVVVGPRGIDASTDGGRSWQAVLPNAPESYWAVAFADAQVGWAVGPDGRILRLAVVRR